MDRVNKRLFYSLSKGDILIKRIFKFHSGVPKLILERTFEGVAEEWQNNVLYVTYRYHSIEIGVHEI